MKQFLKQSLITLCKRLGETSPLLIDWRGLEDLEAASDVLGTMRISRFLEPKVMAAPRDQRILVFAPHPDDEIIGPGGTLLQAIAQGCTVKIVVFTDDGQEVRDEIQAVATAMGAEAEALQFPIRGIPSDPAALHRIPEMFEEFKPDALFLTFMLDDHPDHRQISESVLDTLQTKAFDHIDVWAYQVYTALPLNAVVNVGNVMARKLEILRLYVSRFRKNRDWCHWTQGLNAFNIRFIPQAQSEDYAEVFYKTNLKNYLKMTRLYFKGE